MDRKFKRLTVKERELIGRYFYQNYSQTMIAQLLGVHKSTISRELKRNKFEKFYIPLISQDKSEERRRASYKFKINRNGHMLPYMRKN